MRNFAGCDGGFRDRLLPIPRSYRTVCFRGPRRSYSASNGGVALIYVGEHSFSQLQKADALTKAMLNSWTTDGETNDKTPSHRQPQQNKPLFGIPGNTSNDQKSMYKEYGWLFGKVK